MRGVPRGRGGPAPVWGMVRGVPRPPGNVGPVGATVRPVLNVRPGQPRPGFNMRPGLRPQNNGSLRPNMVRPGVNNGPRPANGFGATFVPQTRMNNGAARPPNSGQRPPNFSKPQEDDEENSNDTPSQSLPSFGNTWGSNFSN